jgi:transposase, IS5 family
LTAWRTVAGSYELQRIIATFAIPEPLSIAILKNEGIYAAITHAERQIEQIHRRVIMGEEIPHHEKVFSIFEEHTEWIVKGKAGCPQELGLRVCMVESRQGFILHYKVMQQQTDDQVTVSIIAETKEQYPELAGCSFDKGFHSQSNQERLKELLDRITMPKKGKLSAADKVREYDPTFQDTKRQHSAVESAIGALQNHGLDVCPDRGLDAFHRYVAIGILARNLQILGHKLQLKEKKRRKRIERYRRTWNDNRAEEVAACCG